MIVREVRIRRKDGAAVLRRRLKGTRGLVKQLGAMMVSDSQGAFTAQRFGEIPWAERYPNQKEPFVNVAGVVQDFASGKAAPTPDRFTRRPANLHTGRLMNSLTSEVVGQDAVQVGTAVEYAQAMHKGLPQTQQITPDVKARLRKWLRNQRVNVSLPASEGKKATRGTIKFGALGLDFSSKLSFLLTKDTLTTQVHARPFIGITQQRSDDFATLVAEHIAGGA